MTLPLKDVGRLGVNEQTHAALTAESAAFGRTMQDVIRDVLDEWAAKKAHAYKVYARQVIANGAQAELPGFDTDDAGGRRKGARL